jgi:hypothetical protein
VFLLEIYSVDTHSNPRLLHSHALTDQERLQASRLNKAYSKPPSKPKEERTWSLTEILYADVRKIKNRLADEERKATQALFNARLKPDTPNKTACPLPETLDFLSKQSQRRKGDLTEWVGTAHLHY